MILKFPAPTSVWHSILLRTPCSPSAWLLRIPANWPETLFLKGHPFPEQPRPPS